MCLVIPLWGWCRKKEKDAEALVDVLVDIDATLVYPAGGGPLKLEAASLDATYSLAHGALEFLAALDALGTIRLGLYSCGSKARNRRLAKALVREIHRQGYTFRQKLEAFSVPDGMHGKKMLKGLRRGLDLDRAILVDDNGHNVQPGEESNLLKIYKIDCHSRDLMDAHKLYRARLCNNLVRALGMIVKSIDVSKASGGSTTVVQALHSLQWDSDNMYLHELSNTKDLYQCGLQAMQAAKPDFSLAYAATYPWSSCQQDDNIFQRRQDLIIRKYTDAF
eukprot:c3815_g1_i1 orf=209-1042(+)